MRNYFQLGLYESHESFPNCIPLEAIESAYKFEKLTSRGYVVSKQFGLDMICREYLIKNQRTESPQHAFLVWAITNWLKENGFQVWNFRTVRPDIIFEYKNTKFAIEIETGKNLSSNKPQFKQKVESLKENFGWNWFFVVTNRGLVRKYKKYGKTYTRKNVVQNMLRHVNYLYPLNMSKVNIFDKKQDTLSTEE